MNTKKFNHPRKPLMIAHRGVSGLETENTNAAFVAAGNRSYYGIETDTHRTADDKFVIFHDDTTGRIAIDNLHIEESTYDTLRGLLLKQKDGCKGRTDLRIPNLEEYIGICKYYEKDAILELKNAMDEADVVRICETVEAAGYLAHVVFISFDFDNLRYVKNRHPEQTVQFLTGNCDDALIARLKQYGMDLDIEYHAVTEALVDACHANGLKVNVWTVDDPADAARLAECGVDFITSNILE